MSIYVVVAVDLYALYNCVQNLGGYDNVSTYTSLTHFVIESVCQWAESVLQNKGRQAPYSFAHSKV